MIKPLGRRLPLCFGEASVPLFINNSRFFASKGRKEIQVWSNLNRDHFLALYLVRRTIFLVSLDTDAYNKDTFCGSLDTEPES